MSEHTPRTRRPGRRCAGRLCSGPRDRMHAPGLAQASPQPAPLGPLLTVDAARRVGWLVYQTHDGAWGRPATRHDLWACKPVSWPANVHPARLHETCDDALAEVEECLAFQVGMTRTALHETVLNALPRRYRAFIEERRR